MNRRAFIGAAGAPHVGIARDLNGIARTSMPSYQRFAALEEALASRKLKEDDILAVLGGNYARVLRPALTA